MRLIPTCSHRTGWRSMHGSVVDFTQSAVLDYGIRLYLVRSQLLSSAYHRSGSDPERHLFIHHATWSINYFFRKCPGNQTCQVSTLDIKKIVAAASDFRHKRKDVCVVHEELSLIGIHRTNPSTC